MQSKLFCRYEVPDPVFTLQPLKAEDSFLEPRITTYHGFLSDQEMDYLKKIAKKKVFEKIFAPFNVCAVLLKDTINTVGDAKWYLWGCSVLWRICSAVEEFQYC